MKRLKDIEFENRFKNVELTMKSLMDEGLVTDKEYNAVGNTLQAIQGKYGTQVPKGFARGAYQFALANAYFLTLPFAALTALSEPLILLARAKPGSALVSANTNFLSMLLEELLVYSIQDLEKVILKKLFKK